MLLAKHEVIVVTNAPFGGTARLATTAPAYLLNLLLGSIDMDTWEGRRAADWKYSPRVPQSRDRARRAASEVDFAKILLLLPQLEHAFVLGEGRTESSGHSTTGNAKYRCDPGSRWTYTNVALLN
jgi:hypothetical protein